MRFRRKALAAASIAVAGALVLAGCTGGSNDDGGSTDSGTTVAFNAAVDEVINPDDTEGGTLNLLASADCDSWDPARTYYGWCLNMQRLFSRTLVNYSKVNGTEFELGADLATDLGTPNADFTEFTYTLKEGLEFSNGEPITPDSIKYAVERSYATDVITGGPGFYLTAIIDAPEGYAGPYTDGRLPDTAIEVTDTTITFKLNKPFADFNYLLALPTSAPVPVETEGGDGFVGDTYGEMPVASGPFMISDYTPTESVTFTRNPNWDQSTDEIRTPLVDEVSLTINTNDDDVDQQLAAGNADARVDKGVGPAFAAELLADEDLMANADNPEGASLIYYVMPTSVPPLDNVHCRRAVQYAVNKAAALQIAGGAAAGAVAQSAVPPGIPGYDPDANTYPNGEDNTGDLEAAQAELEECGQPDGFSTTFAYLTPDETNGQAFQNVQESLARVGIEVEAATANAEDYYSTFIGSPSNVEQSNLGIIAAGWGADFPTLYGFFQNITNGSAILPEGNSNYASIDDPTVNSILDDTETPVTPEIGTQLNESLMETAQFLPMRFNKDLWYRNARMTNVTNNNALGFGAYDVVNVGVGGGE